MNVYSYVVNNPTNYVDPDGEIAISATLLLAWGATEIGLSVYDAYNTGKTVLDSCSSKLDKSLVAGLFIAGLVGPGGGGTGFADDMSSVIEEALIASCISCMHKPLDMGQVLELVEDILARKRESDSYVHD